MMETLNDLLKRTWIPWLVISLIIFMLYSGTLSYGLLFNFDDDAYFNDPTLSRLTPDHVKACFSDYYLGMYQPVPVLTYATVFQLFPGSVVAQRIVNILIFSFSLLLVLVFLRKLTSNRLVAMLTTLLFAVHPMNVEFLSWFSTRGNLLYTFFYLLSLILYLRWRDKNNWARYMLVLLSFIAALFSKVTAATFPFIVILVDWFSGRKFNKKSIFYYLPLFILSAVFIRVGIHSSSSFGHITDIGIKYTLPERILLIFQAVGLYLYKAFVPSGQSVIYLYPWKTDNALPVTFIITSIIAFLVVAGLLITGWILRKKESGKAILLGILFFLLTVSIVLPLKWSRTILIAERYTYLPYLGLFTGFFLLCYQLLKDSRKSLQSAAVVFFAAIVLFFSFLSWNRVKVWENPLTLFTDVIRKNRSGAEVSMGYYNRGNEYLRMNATDRALGDYSEAIHIFPHYAEAYYNRALIHYGSGRYDEAIRDFSNAINYRKDYQPAYINRGTTYRVTGNYDMALSDYNKAISIRSNDLAYFNRGVLYYFNLNNYQQACADWQESLRLGYDKAGEMLDKFCR
jgi:protein O-mannosyl-transferase